MSPCSAILLIFFFFNDTATTEIYTLFLHDALPISEAAGAPRAPAGRARPARRPAPRSPAGRRRRRRPAPHRRDRKSTRLNSSHANISYAVFCLKKKTEHDDYHKQSGTRRQIEGDGG